jgi:hypothetical protein
VRYPVIHHAKMCPNRTYLETQHFSLSNLNPTQTPQGNEGRNNVFSCIFSHLAA